jgi:hypothetical protein
MESLTFQFQILMAQFVDLVSRSITSSVRMIVNRHLARVVDHAL